MNTPTLTTTTDLLVRKTQLATTRLHTGQRIRLDGGTGAIELLDDAPTG